MPDVPFTVEEADIRSAEFSDDAIALQFSAAFDGQLLYVPAWSAWLRWDGCRWRQDDTLAVFDLIRRQCRVAAAAAVVAHPKSGDAMARSITSASTVSAVERLARSDVRHARRAEDFDADPWALNTPAGVVDLRTGQMRPHRRGDLFTKVTAVAPGGDCPRWLQFLREITQDDQEAIDYLQRFIGYTLTGSIEEHAFLFLFGPGGNGKSVLVGTVAAALGDYATTAMQDVFTVGRSDQHPTHIASLRGARMVCVTETEEGRAWAESRIKAITGGDRISARVMRGDPFEFNPVLKLWIAGNHRPTLNNPDPAMRRRLRLMPLTYVPAAPDTKLPDKLRDELPGILAWAIEGALMWQRDGLGQPAVVREATSDYFAAQDSLATWLGERCERKAGAEMSSRAAFDDWRKWCISRGEEAGTEKRFAEAMENHAAKKRKKTGVMFLNVRLLPNESGVW